MPKKKSLVAVVPFRSVTGAKERLATVLSDAERSELGARLLERTLRALIGTSSVDTVLLVSPDPLARALGRSLGATVIDDGGAELNAAIRIGLDAAEQLGAEAALVVPVDLAAITAMSISALLNSWREGSAAGAAQPIGLLAANDGGTAALLLPLPTRLALRYGATSAASHRAAARELNAPVIELHSPLSADIDTAADLAAALAASDAAGATTAVGATAGTAADGLQVIPLDGLGEIVAGDDLPNLIAACVAQHVAVSGEPLRSDDVITVTQKIVSKAEGAIVELATVTPRQEAIDYATRWSRDPRQVEVVLREAVRVVRMDRGVIITETAHGFVLANSGVDASNVGPRSGEIVTLLPRDPDTSARRIRAAIEDRCGVAPGVIVTDSFGRPWRLGITDVAIGVAGIAALDDLRGSPDADGRAMAATVRAVADQIAAAAELALGKSARRPLALVRGAKARHSEEGSVRESLMPPDWDLFR